MYTTELESI